jgi:hypothetical protein
MLHSPVDVRDGSGDPRGANIIPRNEARPFGDGNLIPDRTTTASLAATMSLASVLI